MYVNTFHENKLLVSTYLSVFTAFFDKKLLGALVFKNRHLGGNYWRGHTAAMDSTPVATHAPYECNKQDEHH